MYACVEGFYIIPNDDDGAKSGILIKSRGYRQGLWSLLDWTIVIITIATIDTFKLPKLQQHTLVVF